MPQQQHTISAQQARKLLESNKYAFDTLKCQNRTNVLFQDRIPDVSRKTPEEFIAESYRISAESGAKVAASLKQYLNAINIDLKSCKTLFPLTEERIIQLKKFLKWANRNIKNYIERAKELVTSAEANVAAAKAREAKAIANPVPAGTLLLDANFAEHEDSFTENLEGAIAGAKKLDGDLNATINAVFRL
jgi:hypothetical protein